MKAGDIITISRNRITGDRSYSHGLYQIIGMNDLHVSVKSLTDRSSPWRKKTFFLNIDEHDFSYAGVDMLPENERAKVLVHLNFAHVVGA